MARKQTAWKIKGMNRDLSVSAFNPEFAFENRNLRLATNENNTLMSWVNERGTLNVVVSITINSWASPSTVSYIEGIPIGTAVINDKLVLFTTNDNASNKDFIYVLQCADTNLSLDPEGNKMVGRLIYNGNLNFNTSYPLETLVSYETEHIQKVYWTDGYNQPRVINIVADDDTLAKWNASIGTAVDTFFDFVPAISYGNFFISVSKAPSSSGTFAPGVIQYCMTYSNEYGQESNIVWVSDLQYIAHSDRGASPEDKVNTSYKISIQGPDVSHFDYIRLYSIQRTSLDSEPLVKLLTTIKIKDLEYYESGNYYFGSYTDNGTTGSVVDPYALLYVGGKDIKALTMAEKDNKLFLGNIQQKNLYVEDIQNYFNDLNTSIVDFVRTSNKRIPVPQTYNLYNYDNQLDNSQKKITTFKGGERYRFGFQLQRKTGEWTYPIFIEDKTNNVYPDLNGTYMELVKATATIPTKALEDSLATAENPHPLSDYAMIRPVVVYPTINDRTVLCQGIITPTVFNVVDRMGNSPYAQSSWFFRPYVKSINHASDSSITNIHGSIDPPQSIPLEQYTQTVPQFVLEDGYSNVYILVGDVNKQQLSSVLAKRSLHFTANVYDSVTGVTSITGTDIPFLGIIYLQNSDLFVAEHSKIAFVFDVSEPLPASNTTGTTTTTITWDELRTWEYDNISFKMYWDMHVGGNQMLYYHKSRSGSTYDIYEFNFHAGTYEYTVPFNTLDSDPIASKPIQGYDLRFTHYDSVFTSESLNDDDNSHYDNYRVEIQGSVKRFDTPYVNEDHPEHSKNSNAQFFIDQSIQTFHSPDIEFDTDVQVYGTDNLKMRIVGVVPITSSVSSSKITAGSMLEASHNNSPTEYIYGSGDLEKKLMNTGSSVGASRRTIASYLWNDVVVTEDTTKEDKVTTEPKPYDFLVYPWQRTGSLNNDWRTEDTASSWLKTKKESTLLFSNNTVYSPSLQDFGDVDAGMFLTENNYILNMRLPGRTADAPNGINYYPNINKILYNADGFYPIFNITYNYEKKKLNSPVSMKYKSTSHAVISFKQIVSTDSSNGKIPIAPSYSYGGSPEVVSGAYTNNSWANSPHVFWGDTLNPKFYQEQKSGITELGNSDFVWLAELYKEIDNNSVFGGNTKDALMANNWLVAGDTVPFIIQNGGMSLEWTYGDTYYQRYDCMKTYPFTKEDPNQIVEILSFMCETRVNIDGRYDKNRGQIDNYNFDPTIFNNINPIYSQKNNFFQSRILYTPKDDYLAYPNTIYYSMNKKPGAEIDAYTNVTLATTLDLDGDKGKISNIERFNNELIAFQDTGISQILYNERTQISTAQGVPIEIANSGSVDGKRYLSDTIGCSNKWSIITSPSGIYFMDSKDKSIYVFNGQLNNLSLTKGFNTWCKNNISLGRWTPRGFNDASIKNDYVSYYDKQNQEVLFLDNRDCLAYSEKLGTFTSFYDYTGAPFFENFNNSGFWFKTYNYTDTVNNTTVPRCKIYKHQEGDYCNFFGENKPYWMTLIGNPEPQIDKIFTNLEFRACVDGDGELSQSTGRFSFALPFNSLEAWDEYQHGLAHLEDKSGHGSFMHNLADKTAALKRKFRIWRCDIPRDNVDIVTIEPVLPDNPTEEQQAAYDAALIKYNQYLADEGNHIYRTIARPIDRMRNPWVYLKLFKNAASTGNTLPRAEIHDMIMTYFG